MDPFYLCDVEMINLDWRVWSENERFSAIAISTELDRMKVRWRKRLLQCCEHNLQIDGFQWDDGRALGAYRRRNIADYLRYENRVTKLGITDWSEALPSKVLLCTDPYMMLVLSHWDMPLAVDDNSQPPPRAPVMYSSGLGVSTTRVGALTAMFDSKSAAGASTKDNSEEPPVAAPVAAAELVFADSSVADHKTDLVGLVHSNKPPRGAVVGRYIQKPVIVASVSR